MITRGIVEKIIDRYNIKVRLPMLDRVATSETFTPVDELNTAVICTLPSCDMNVRVGDVVFVAFEDGGERKSLILGYLYRSEMTETYCDMILGALTTKGTTRLSASTSIGDVSSKEINRLKGVKDNIQGQINTIEVKLQDIYERLLSLENNGGNA